MMTYMYTVRLGLQTTIVPHVRRWLCLSAVYWSSLDIQSSPRGSSMLNNTWALSWRPTLFNTLFDHASISHAHPTTGLAWQVHFLREFHQPTRLEMAGLDIFPTTPANSSTHVHHIQWHLPACRWGHTPWSSDLLQWGWVHERTITHRCREGTIRCLEIVNRRLELSTRWSDWVAVGNNMAANVGGIFRNSIFGRDCSKNTTLPQCMTWWRCGRGRRVICSGGRGSGRGRRMSSVSCFLLHEIFHHHFNHGLIRRWEGL